MESRQYENGCTEEFVRKIVEEDTYALNLAKTVEIKELVGRYGNENSDKIFFKEDYKAYLLNCYLENVFEQSI